MARSRQAKEEEAKVVEFKRFITSGCYETQEMLEDAVDAFLWGDEDAAHEAETAGTHPK